ncbi:MAG: hypothetical protein JSS81_18575 [Acidobacteria bacterium]|nr:hypothetical protein [Acidobacteriota bacterium]
MNDDDFPNEKHRPTAFDDRPRYRFEDYEDDDQTPAELQPKPWKPARDRETTEDEKHLDQLSLGFKIYAAISALFACFPFIHLFIGIMILTGGMDGGRDAPPPAVGWFFIGIASVFILLGWTFAACNFFAGRFLKERRNYIFCFVMSCLNCAFMPLGTVLGVFSIIVLIRDSVKKLFEENSEAGPLR